MDYELFVFEEILNKKQLEIYLDERERQIKYHEENLAKADNSEHTLRIVKDKMEEIKYLETEFLPDLLKANFNRSFIMHPQKTKYDFLNEEYRNFLNERKKEIISQHFRHSRNFQPNNLKKELLGNKIEAMCPNFLMFKAKMDEATIAIAESLKSNFKMLDIKKDLIASKRNELAGFRKKAADDYFSYIRESGGGFFYGSSEDLRTNEEKETDIYFSIILIDEDFYGFK